MQDECSFQQFLAHVSWLCTLVFILLLGFPCSNSFMFRLFDSNKLGLRLNVADTGRFVFLIKPLNRDRSGRNLWKVFFQFDQQKYVNLNLCTSLKPTTKKWIGSQLYSLKPSMFVFISQNLMALQKFSNFMFGSFVCKGRRGKS